MSSFKTPLVIEFDFNGDPKRPYVLREPFSYYTDLLLNLTIIDVPAGYRTDFASIPRFFWRILPPAGPWGKAAVIHDWLCDVSPRLCSHLIAADVFAEAMGVLEVPAWKTHVMVWAVKHFGPKFRAGDR